MCSIKECKKKRVFISMISDINSAEKELIKCEKCCANIETLNKHKEATYLEARTRYVKLFWRNH